MEAKVYNQSGKEAGAIELPESVFGVKWNSDLVHQVVEAIAANARPTVAHTKTRGEVRGGGRKPWRQKGTGRARHGSRRSPIWRGGGVTHGPRKERVFARTTTKKMRARALASVLSQKFKDNEIIFVDALMFGEPNTKEAKGVLNALARAGFSALAKKKNAALLAIPEKDAALERSFRNFGNIAIEEVRNVNPLDLLSATYVIFVSPGKSVAALEGRVVKSAPHTPSLKKRTHSGRTTVTIAAPKNTEKTVKTHSK